MENKREIQKMDLKVQNSKLVKSQEEADKQSHRKYSPQIVKKVESFQDTKSCSIPSAILRILNSLKLKREESKSNYELRNLYITYKNQIKRIQEKANQCRSEGQRKTYQCIIAIYLFETVSVTKFMRDLRKTNNAVNKLETYTAENHLHLPLLELGKCSAYLFYYLAAKDVAQSRSKLKEMISLLGMIRSGYEVHMMHYAIGVFLFKLLTLKETNSQREIIPEIANDVSDYVLHSGIRPRLTTYRRCVQYLRSCAYEAFRIAREGVIKGYAESYSDINYFYQDQQEPVYALVMMAKVKLDVPESEAGQTRNMVSAEDLQLATECLHRAQQELHVQNITPSPRLKARMDITEAGIAYRQYQLLSSFEGVEDHTRAGLSYLMRAERTLEAVRDNLMRSNLDEAHIANCFRSFIKNRISCLEFILKNGNIAVFGSLTSNTTESEEII